MKKMNPSGVTSRTHKAKLNMLFSLLSQVVALICGLVIPQLMINTYGSEAYGATSSIANFLSYIILLEGGMGAVTRSALYKAFADRSNDQISSIICETKSFFRKVAIGFIVYVLIIALFFKQISHNDTFSYWYSFSLVIVIALSTFAEYFVGISYSVLLQADQVAYIGIIFKIIATIFNTIGVIVLVSLKCDILFVKLLSSIVFVIRPILLSLYVKKRYRLKEIHSEKKYLRNKGTALGQHIAWTIHNNTDITVLTVFKDLSLVSVYSVYYMVVSQLQSLLNSFTAGMEAVFGNMYANKEKENLLNTFGYYETLISILGITVFSTAAVLIVPFIRLYTSGVTDADYINMPFAFFLIIASLLYIFRTPYGHMIIAAGRFKETRVAAYGEAIINIIVSVVLVIKLGLVGVAIGTVLATLFRFVWYVFYLSKHILHRSIGKWLKRMIINTITFMCAFIVGNLVLSYFEIKHYAEFIVPGILITTGAGLLTIGFNLLLFRKDVFAIIKKLLKTT